MFFWSRLCFSCVHDICFFFCSVPVFFLSRCVFFGPASRHWPLMGTRRHPMARVLRLPQATLDSK